MIAFFRILCSSRANTVNRLIALLDEKQARIDRLEATLKQAERALTASRAEIRDVRSRLATTDPKDSGPESAV